MAPLIRGRVLETVVQWPKQWFFLCTVMLVENEADTDYRSIVQFTDGPSSLTFGSRIVALFTRNLDKICFSTFLYGNDGTLFSLLYCTPLILGREYDISIRYVEDTAAGNFRYKISLDGILVSERVSWKTEDLSNVQICISNKYIDPSSIHVKNLRYGEI